MENHVNIVFSSLMILNLYSFPDLVLHDTNVPIKAICYLFPLLTLVIIENNLDALTMIFAGHNTIIPLARVFRQNNTAKLMLSEPLYTSL